MADRRIVCICCGCESSSIYTDFAEGVIRLKRCENCRSVVDRYVECDFIVLLLDMLLHKPEAFRHLLFNRKIAISSQMKFWFICVICTAYVKWNDHGHIKHSGILAPSLSIPEICFTTLALQAIAEMIAFVLGTSLGVWILVRCSSTYLSPPNGWTQCVHSLCLASYGHILVFPLALWAQAASCLVKWLPVALVFTSTLQAVRVLGFTNQNSLSALIPPSFGLTCQVALTSVIRILTAL